MEKTAFHNRCCVRMAALDISQAELGEQLESTQAKVALALRGDKSSTSATLRVKIDQALTRKVGEKRKKMAEDLRKATAVQAPHLEGELSLILPEDMMYIVLEDGIPVGLWNPETKSYRELPPTLGLG